MLNKYQKQRVLNDFTGNHREYIPETEKTPVIHTKMPQMEQLARLVVALHRESTTEEKVLAYIACFSVHGEYKTANGNRKLMCQRLGINKSTYTRTLETLVQLGVLKKLSTGNATNQYVSYRLHPDLFNAREREGQYTFKTRV